MTYSAILFQCMDLSYCGYGVVATQEFSKLLSSVQIRVSAYKYPKKYKNIMENLRIRCKSCNRELEGRPSKTVSCGCSNMATIVNNSKITALDLNNIVMLNSPNTKKNNNILTTQDIMWQEERRQRKVRRLDFEVR
jgi:hypothetical protein